jgi:hypothetical protein
MNASKSRHLKHAACSSLIALALSASSVLAQEPTTFLLGVKFERLDFIYTGEWANFDRANQNIRIRVFPTEVTNVVTGEPIRFRRTDVQQLRSSAATTLRHQVGQDGKENPTGLKPAP